MRSALADRQIAAHIRAATPPRRREGLLDAMLNLGPLGWLAALATLAGLCVVAVVLFAVTP